MKKDPKKFIRKLSAWKVVRRNAGGDVWVETEIYGLKTSEILAFWTY